LMIDRYPAFRDWGGVDPEVSGGIRCGQRS
jgi:hypothetical protein